jgi:NAD(P)-dependent dehydrogenase (short-subunit alcohol dehydrogenase family)
MSAFANQVVLVTGSGSGLGRQLAKDLAAQGAAIAAIDLIAEPLRKLADELPGSRLAYALADVRDRAALRNAACQLARQLGPIDILIANAGIGIETSALAFRAADIEAQIQVNLIGVANSVEAVLPEMLERKQGHLVAISSLASYRGLPKMLGYCASKAGVNGLMDGLRAELKPHGIVVTTICPGWIRTPLTQNIQVPQPHIMELPYAAARIVAAIRARRAFLAFPALAAWQIRLLKWLPCRTSDWLMSRMLQYLLRKEAGEQTPAAPGR